MKRTYFVIFFLSLLFTGCCFLCIEESRPSIEPVPPTAYEAISKARADLNKSVQLESPRDIVNSGKIYVFKEFLFVGEKRKGFHVFDNSNPKSPKKIKFIQVLGSTDIALRDHVLYINQATDLLTLKYNFVDGSLKLMKRIENIFPELSSPDGYRENSAQDSVVIDWKLKTQK